MPSHDRKYPNSIALSLAYTLQADGNLKRNTGENKFGSANFVWKLVKNDFWAFIFERALFFQAASDLGIFHSFPLSFFLAQSRGEFEKKCSRNHNGLAQFPNHFEITKILQCQQVKTSLFNSSTKWIERFEDHWYPDARKISTNNINPDPLSGMWSHGVTRK